MDKSRLSSAGVTSKCTTAVTFSRLSAGVTSKLAQPLYAAGHGDYALILCRHYANIMPNYADIMLIIPPYADYYYVVSGTVSGTFLQIVILCGVWGNRHRPCPS